MFHTTRRAVLIGAAALALAPSLALADAASKVNIADLMAPGALPDIVEGKADAPVTVVEYASLTCPHCANFYMEVFPTLKKNYIDTGKVKFVYRDFPLDALAAGGAMLARCSGDKRNAVVELLFSQQKNWAFVDKPLDALQATMKQTGMSDDSFKKCLDDRALYQNVIKDRETAATKFSINSTPTFFVNGERKTGEFPAADLDKWLGLTPAEKK
ncbi:MAG: DsbA family protein [Hyphomicrobiales bacterium]|nr:DsbA family protein [Hyphomicrobiales bacterium]